MALLLGWRMNDCYEQFAQCEIHFKLMLKMLNLNIKFHAEIKIINIVLQTEIIRFYAPNLKCYACSSKFMFSSYIQCPANSVNNATTRTGK